MRSGEQDDVASAEAGRTPVEVVREWDTLRSEAWAQGNVEALGDLYLPGVRVGRDDAAMLKAYVTRGLRVQGMETQLLAVDEIRTAEDEMVLQVTDRVHAGTVTGAGMERPLPRDAVSTRRLTFRLYEGSWRVVRVLE